MQPSPSGRQRTVTCDTRSGVEPQNHEKTSRSPGTTSL